MFFEGQISTLDARIQRISPPTRCLAASARTSRTHSTPHMRTTGYSHPPPSTSSPHTPRHRRPSASRQTRSKALCAHPTPTTAATSEWKSRAAAAPHTRVSGGAHSPLEALGTVGVSPGTNSRQEAAGAAVRVMDDVQSADATRELSLGGAGVRRGGLWGEAGRTVQPGVSLEKIPRRGSPNWGRGRAPWPRARGPVCAAATAKTACLEAVLGSLAQPFGETTHNTFER